MPTISSGINIALQAILAQSQALEITDHNVANANTPGYRRQSAVLAATVPTSVFGSDFGPGAGQRGTGVTVQSIQRFNLSFFDTRFRGVSADTKGFEAQRDVLVQLQSTMAETSDAGLQTKLDTFWAGWQLLASDPSNISLRTQLLDQSKDVANAFQTRSAQMIQLRNDQDQAVTQNVGQINTLASQIAQVNGEIARVQSVGQQPNDLLDNRDQLLDQLSGISGSVSNVQANGEVMVSVGGHVLVNGHDSFAVTTVADPLNNNLAKVQWSDGQTFNAPSGTLKGLLDARDNVIKSQQTSLDLLANNLMTEINAIHTTGVDLNNQPGLAFFQGGSGATDIHVNAAINDPSKIAASNAANAPGDNTIAVAISNLKFTKLAALNNGTINEFQNARVTDLALKTQDATNSATQNGVVQKALSDQRDSVAGVSLDEEAANMSKYQKGYQAAARVMTAYDQLLDTVINSMGMAGR